MPERESVNGTKTAQDGKEVQFMARGGRSGAMKWGLIGGGIAAGAVLIPLIPAIKKRAMRVTTILKKDHRMVSGMIATLQLMPRMNGIGRRTLFEQIRNNVMLHA